MTNKFNLVSDQILNKKFDTEISGYSPIQVDKYLDEILSDYRKYEELLSTNDKKITNIESLVADKDDELERLRIELANAKHTLKNVENTSTAQVLKRLNKLEMESR